MKKLLFAALSLAISASSFGQASSYTVDVEESNITWVGEKVTGSHTGNISFKSGVINLTDEKISGTVYVDMESMTCTDLDPDYGDKLIGHLESTDFFGVSQHPESHFEFKSWTLIEDEEDDEDEDIAAFEINGELTIKGITKPASFIAGVTFVGDDLILAGELIFDRTEFGIKYGSGSFIDDLGDKAIYDEVKLNIEIIGKAQ